MWKRQNNYQSQLCKINTYVSRKQKRDVKIVSKSTAENNPNKYFHQMQTGHCPDWGGVGRRSGLATSDKVNSKQKALPRGGQFVLSGILRFQ